MTQQDKRKTIAQRISADTVAPLYHFIAPEGNAMPFDPNGAIYWNDTYHLSYIFHKPEKPYGGHCWRHVSSKDLLHCPFHLTPLAPSPDGPKKGIFSDNAVVSKDGIPTITY